MHLSMELGVRFLSAHRKDPFACITNPCIAFFMLSRIRGTSVQKYRIEVCILTVELFCGWETFCNYKLTNFLQIQPKL